MALQSMTGFAREDGISGFGTWIWEMRSVNGKGLDIRLRLPSGMEDLDNEIRKRVGQHLKRGNVQISLQFQRSDESETLIVNEDLAESLWQSAEKLQSKFGGQMPTISELMAMRGVVEIAESALTEEERNARALELTKSFDKVLSDFVSGREREGKAIATVLRQQVQQIEELQIAIDQNDARTESSIRTKLSAQIARLVEASNALDEQRLHQEAAILAAKADLQEEIDRLAVHISSAKEMLSSDGPIGRKLDFLAQEFNRECNTICSKSNDSAVTTLGLDMKIVIDQFREQIQNME